MKAPAAIRFRLIATGLAVIGLGAYGVLWFRDNGAAVETDNAYIRSEITPVAPKVTGYVTEVAIGDDQLVRAADILFRIDDADYRARVLQAEGVVAERHAALANADERIRLQETAVRQARATIQATEADAQRTRLDWERASQLLQMGSGSRQKFDTASADRTRLRAQSDRDQANLAAAQQTISVLLTERDQKAAQLTQAEAALALARIDLENTVVRAPVSGVVGQRQVRVGQYAKPGAQLLALVPADELWVVANFKETQLSRMQIGQRVAVAVDSLGGQLLQAKVASMAPASGAEFSLLPPDNATGNFTKIVQRIPVKIVFEKGQDLSRLRPGMSVVASVDLASAATVPSSRIAAADKGGRP